MTDVKSLWRSRSFWAGAIGFAASLAGLVGLKVDPARAAELADLMPLIVVNVTSAAGVMFRILAEARIGGAPANPAASGDQRDAAP
jgi:hypothetical protein